MSHVNNQGPSKRDMIHLGFAEGLRGKGNMYMVFVTSKWHLGGNVPSVLA